MRGKASRVIPLDSFLRITPAHAGKSLTVHKIMWFSKDHPRTCGEKGKTYLQVFRLTRITPAHAGKSI